MLDDFGIVPLGMPIIAGPATLATLLVLVETVGPAVTVVALALNLVMVYVAFRFCHVLKRWIGESTMRAVSKIITLLLAAIAVHLIRKGWAAQ